MKSVQRVRLGIAALALAAVTVTGCASTIAGTPVLPAAVGSTAPPSSGGTPTSGGVPTTGGTVAPVGPSGIPDSEVGLKPGVPTAELSVSGDQDTQSDQLAKDTLVDVIDFYTQTFPQAFGEKFVPPQHFYSYDSQDKNATICKHSLYQSQNAAYASPPCDTVVWDRGVLLPHLIDSIGILSVPTVFAHEMGHRVQTQLKFDDSKNSVLVGEQQADCYAGAYWRWVSEGNSTYFNFNESEGMRQALNTMLAVRDPAGGDPSADDGTGQGAHGDAFDRTYAFSLGYANGVKDCSTIDQASVDARVSESPFHQIPDPKNAGSLPITDQVLSDVADTVNEYFGKTSAQYRPPTLTGYSGGSPPACDGFTASTPVSYCPPTNTVTYDLPELQRIGTPTAGFDSYNGDFSAIVLLVSRYALAAQAAGKAPVTGDQAGLRALCYAGTWASWMRHPQGPKKLALSPADLDKAVYELINSPLPASDANGAGSTAIFDRVQAFGIGVTHPIDTCFDFFSG
jgi:predicted metalloprotease